MRKRLFTIMCALASVLWGFNVSAEVVEYACGATESDNVTATLDTETGVMTISGIGAMTDYLSVHQRPWYANISDISTCVLAEGVTNVGNIAFSGCGKMTRVLLASTVNKIGTRAFQSCEELTTVIYEGENELTVGSNAFYNVAENAVFYVKAGRKDYYSTIGALESFEVKEITLALDITEATIGYAESVTLTPTYTLADFVGDVDYTWTSSEMTVATVADGVVSPVNPGETDVKVSVVTPSGNTLEAVCRVTVVDAATGIENVKVETNSDGVIYDLMGRKVENPAQGIYVKNGKKFIVR